MTINWTDAKVKKLKKLWSKNIPSRDIAKHLGEGISRNAIIGKANRLGLNKTVEPKEVNNIIEKEDALLDTKGCRWPFGDPGHEDFHFCGAVQVPGKPYCLEHCMLAYRKKESRRG